MSAERVLGLALVALGAVLLVVLTTDVGPESVVAFIGGGFLVAYVATRNYGFLVPGGILTGLGTGIILTGLGMPGEMVLMGLGSGFTLIAVVDLLVSRGTGAWWWPLIPGGVLLTVGASTMAGITDVGAYLVPAGLIVIGLVLLLRRGGTSDAESASDGTKQPSHD